MTELLGFEEDILSGFEGYHRMGDIVAKEIVMFDGNMGNFENKEQSNLEQVSFPSKKSCGPSLGVLRDNSTARFPETYSQQD